MTVRQGPEGTDRCEHLLPRSRGAAISPEPGLAAPSTDTLDGQRQSLPSAALFASFPEVLRATRSLA